MTTEKCNEDVFKNGVSLGFFDMTKAEAEAYCIKQTQDTGRLHDWHYAGGRVHIKAMPVKPHHGDCKACQDRVKNWKGDDSKCAFRSGPFDGNENWNCALMGPIRQLVEKPDVRGVYRFCEDAQQYATVSTLAFDVLPREDEQGYLVAQPVCLWVGWYKSRGRTEAMWLMFESTPPRPPTEEEYIKILEHYTQTKS